MGRRGHRSLPHHNVSLMAMTKGKTWTGPRPPTDLLEEVRSMEARLVNKTQSILCQHTRQAQYEQYGVFVDSTYFGIPIYENPSAPLGNFPKSKVQKLCSGFSGRFLFFGKETHPFAGNTNGCTRVMQTQWGQPLALAWPETFRPNSVRRPRLQYKRRWLSQQSLRMGGTLNKHESSDADTFFMYTDN